MCARFCNFFFLDQKSDTSCSILVLSHFTKNNFCSYRVFFFVFVSECFDLSNCHRLRLQTFDMPLHCSVTQRTEFRLSLNVMYSVLLFCAHLFCLFNQEQQNGCSEFPHVLESRWHLSPTTSFFFCCCSNAVSSHMCLLIFRVYIFTLLFCSAIFEYTL